MLVCRAEGIQRSGSAAPGSPSVNRDVGTTKPVYISSVLTGTSRPGIRGHGQHTGLMCVHRNMCKQVCLDTHQPSIQEVMWVRIAMKEFVFSNRNRDVMNWPKFS